MNTLYCVYSSLNTYISKFLQLLASDPWNKTYFVHCLYTDCSVGDGVPAPVNETTLVSHAESRQTHSQIYIHFSF